MADTSSPADGGGVTPTPPPAVVDLTARRAGRDRAVAAVATAPVRHVPAALLDALMGSWGTAEQLGLARSARRLQVVAG